MKSISQLAPGRFPLSWCPVLVTPFFAFMGCHVGHGHMASAVLDLKSKALRCGLLRSSCIFFSPRWVLWCICWTSWVVKSDGRMIRSSGVLSHLFLYRHLDICSSSALSQHKLEILAVWVWPASVLRSDGPVVSPLDGVFFFLVSQKCIAAIFLDNHTAHKRSKIFCLFLIDLPSAVTIPLSL